MLAATTKTRPELPMDSIKKPRTILLIRGSLIFPQHPTSSQATEIGCQSDSKQVFWLPDYPTHHTFPAHLFSQWFFVVFVPGYSGGPAADLHGIPFLGDCPSRQPATLNFSIIYKVIL